MRSMVYIYITMMATMLLVAIISFITMKSSYMEAIESNMDDAIVYSVKMIQTDRELLGSEYDRLVDNVSGMESLSSFKQSFVNYLVENLDSRLTGLEVDIYGVDEVNGMLSVKLTGDYVYPFGVKDSVSTYKTVILDKYIRTDYNDN